MVINFRVLEISRDMCKLTWITILIIKKISFLQNIYIYIYIYKRLKSGLKKWTCTHEIFNIMANRFLVIKKPTNLGLHKGWIDGKSLANLMIIQKTISSVFWLVILILKFYIG